MNSYKPVDQMSVSELQSFYIEKTHDPDVCSVCHRLPPRGRYDLGMLGACYSCTVKAFKDMKKSGLGPTKKEAKVQV